MLDEEVEVESVHVPLLNVPPAPPSLQVTVDEGADGVPGLISLTVIAAEISASTYAVL